METQELSRWEILNGDYEWPQEKIILKPTNHYYERLAERGVGIADMPSVVQVTRDNIYSGKTKDGKRLCSVVIRLHYTPAKLLFLCFNPYDGGLKTMWFVDTTIRRRQHDNQPKDYGENC